MPAKGSSPAFEVACALFGGAFAIAFAALVLPAVLETGDVIGAFAAGFANPFASGYALDVICCALILATWVICERRQHGIRHGWIAIVLSFAPGVATAFAFYLVLRSRQGRKKVRQKTGAADLDAPWSRCSSP